MNDHKPKSSLKMTSSVKVPCILQTFHYFHTSVCSNVQTYPYEVSLSFPGWLAKIKCSFSDGYTQLKKNNFILILIQHRIESTWWLEIQILYIQTSFSKHTFWFFLTNNCKVSSFDDDLENQIKWLLLSSYLNKRASSKI